MLDRMIIAHLDRAQNLLNSAHSQSIRFVVSFGDPGTPSPDNIYADGRLVLRLECHDLSPGASYDNQHCYPARSHVHKLISFSKLIQMHRMKQDRILFHCYGGIARAPAAAAIFLKLTTSLPNEAIYKTIMQLRPCAEPNFYLLQYADQILDSSLLALFQEHRKVTC